MNTETGRHPGLNLGSGHADAHGEAEALVFGFWVFMMSDLVTFGLLLATYVTMLDNLAGGPGPKDLFELRPVFIETIVLLTSSLTYGMAVLSLKHGPGHRVGPVLAWLGLTLMLGLAFVAMEAKDLHAILGKGGAPQRSGFLSAYWALVPLHALHVMAAALWLMAIAAQIWRFGLDTPVKTALLRLGVLWHFLDVVWIAIVSVVFLGGLA
ncbi:cytochrome c oxidase subunit 3 [Limimaricola sp. AA108-03]|uniref:cytochrome c oxidase subunit 3 n=1 Tax=Limimaricola sp. AA108-03 TaxID=3425945 RepID=UPI003D77F5FA